MWVESGPAVPAMRAVAIPFLEASMLSLLLFGIFGLAAAVVVGSLGLVFGLVATVVTLPFKILGAVFHLLGFLLTLPFLLIGAVLGGVGLLVALTVGLIGVVAPLLPVLLVGWGIWWLVRRSHGSRASAAW